MVTSSFWLAVTCVTAAVLPESLAVSDDGYFLLGEETHLFDFLTNSSRYDPRTLPMRPEALEVRTSVFLYFLGNIEAQNLEFEAHLLIRQRWQDDRLKFNNVTVNIDTLEGEGWFANNIWTPNIFIENEVNSDLMRMTRDSVYIGIENSGLVNYHYRVRTVVLCDMQLSRFPHDSQLCTIKMESWVHSVTEVILKWENVKPLARNEYIQPEYRIDKESTRETVSVYQAQSTSPRFSPLLPEDGGVGNYSPLKGRKANGNYSTLIIEFTLVRELGHYVIDYYVPSSLLVMMSWVSFWLDPNAVPGRTTLGTATWLTFITLTKNTGSDQLPKVSYIKFLDVWFLACTCFIFLALIEFAVVNTIWRRKDSVELSKLSGKHILKEGLKELGRSALTTPSFSRKNSRQEQEEYEKGISRLRNKRRNSDPEGLFIGQPRVSNETINTFSLSSNEASLPRQPVCSADQPFQFFVSSENDDKKAEEIVIPIPNQNQLTEPRSGAQLWSNVFRAIRRRKHSRFSVSEVAEQTQEHESHSILASFQTMTYEEIAIWIDTKARVLFPVLFIVFVILYAVVVSNTHVSQIFFES